MPTEEITLDEQKRTQLDENLRAMSEGGADNDAIVAYANDFKKKYGSPKSNAPSNTGGESGARITPSTSTLPSAGSELGSWTTEANPLKPAERPIQVPVAKGKPMPIQEAPSNIKLFEDGKPIRQEPKKTKLGTVAFDINEVKRNVAENPIAPIPLTADQAFNEVKNLEMRTSSVDNLYKGQSKIFNAKKAVLTQYESELNAIKQQVEKAKAEGDINTANRLIESAQPIIKQYDSQAKELRKQAIKLEYLDDRKKTLESDMIGISENQQYTTNQWQALNSGLNTLTAGALRAPSFVYNTMIALQNKIAKETGVPIYANPQTDGYLQQAAKYFEDNAEAYSKVIEKKKQQADYSIQNLFENGEYAKAFNLISESVMESAPTTAAIALGGIGGVGALGTTLGGAAVFGSQTFEENKKKGIDDNTNYINSWVNGTLEGIFEATGTLQIVKHGADLFKKEGVKAVEETAKTIWQQVYGKVAKKMFPATSAVLEGVSEAETAFTQNYVNMISGVDTEYKKKYNQIANSDMNDDEKQDALSMLSKKHLFQGVPDAFYVGAAMGGGMGLMQPKQGYTAVNNDKKNEIKKAQETLDNLNKTLTNPLVSADAKDIIQSKADAEAERISLLTEEDDRQLRETLNKDEYEAVTNIQAKIETLEKSLDAIDDKDSKALVEQQIKELEVEKQGILVSSADNLATRVQEKRKELGVEFDPLEGLSDAVASTFERVEGNLPTDINAVQEASDFIYKKYKELQAMKSAKTRPLTIAQINDFMGQMEKDITMLENYKEEQRKSIERTLEKNTSPTNENYGTINRNDGNGVVSLTKEEFEAEQANMQPKADGTAPVEKPTDEQIAKDIKDRNFATFTYESESEVPEVLKDRISSTATTDGKTTIRVTLPKSEADYLLQQQATPEATAGETIKTKTNEKANEDGEQKRGKDGKENVPKSVQSEGEVGGNEVNLQEKQVLAPEGAVTAAPIENPKVLIQGTRQGTETFESSNYALKADGKVTEARGLTFDENGVSIQKDNKGNQIVHIKVDATDSFSRRGNLQVSVIVPEGTNVNTKAIKEIIDAKVAEIKAKGNEELRLGKVQQSDFTALKDAIVNELKNPSAAKSKAEAAPNEEDINNKISVSGLRDGHTVSRKTQEKTTKDSIQYTQTFDPRTPSGENSKDSFIKTIDDRGKKYRVVGLRMSNPKTVLNGQPDRSGMSYAMIVDDGNLPSNIDELLIKKAIQEGKDIYEKIVKLEDSDFKMPSEYKPKTEAAPNVEASSVADVESAYGNFLLNEIDKRHKEKYNGEDIKSALAKQFNETLADRGENRAISNLEDTYMNYVPDGVKTEAYQVLRKNFEKQQSLKEAPQVEVGNVKEETKAEEAQDNNVVIKALEDVEKARSVKYAMQPEFSSESRQYPQKGKPNSIVKIDSDNQKSDDIVAYDNDGKIVGVFSISKEGKEQGAFKITVRDDATRQGWGKKLLNEAEAQGIDIVNNVKKNSFSSSGRDLVRNWLEDKIQTNKPITNEKSSQKTDQEGSTEGGMLEEPRDGRTQDEGGKESTELRTEEKEVEPTQAEGVKGNGKVGGYNPRFKSAKKIQGEETTIEMPDGETREAEYMVVESDDILASHNEVAFSDTEGFPKTADGRNANSRNYKGDNSAQLKVNDDARNLKSSIVISDTATTDGGVPIISTDGIVISGNGRTMAIKLSQKIAPEKYAAYKADLLRRAVKFGINPKEIANMKNPVLVKIDKNVKDYSVKTFDDYNGKYQKEESPTDKAIKRSSIIKADKALKGKILDIVGRHETMSDLFENRQDRKELFNLLVANNIILKQETPKYLTDKGEFTPEGKDIVNDILIATILNPKTLEATNSVKAFRNKIINSLPVLSANYKLGDNSLEQNINDAVLLQSKIASMGSQEDFWTHLGQIGMFDVVDPDVVVINRMINNGADKFKKFIVAYNKSMEIDEESNLFGGDEVLTKQQVIDNLKQSNLNENERKVIANLEELYAANEQKRPIGNVEVVGGNEAEQETPKAEQPKPTEPTEKLTDPKNASDLAKTYRNKFKFSPKQSVWAARLFDAKATFMSKVLGISKEDYYSQYWFGVNEGEGGLSQLTLPDGRKVAVKSVSAEVVNGFYSNTENALGQVKQEKMSGNQWATQLLSRGANKEEMQITGLEAFLKENAAKSVSKADIQQFLKDNRIQVVEVVKQDNADSYSMDRYEDFPQEVKEIADEAGEDADAFEERLIAAGYEVDRDIDGSILSFNKKGEENKFNKATRFGNQPKLQLEGEKSNYKEVLVTMPSKETEEGLPEGYKIIKKEDYKGAWEGTENFVIVDYDGYSVMQGKTEKEALSSFNKLRKGTTPDKNAKFKSTHFSEPNILVHLRMNTRTDADGNKVLFLEEIQSDWGQTGKREGFKPTFEIRNEKGKFNIYSSVNNMKESAFSFDTKEEADKMLETLNKANQNKIVQAPFVMDTNAWTKLGLKYALKEAVKQGATKIAWTTGEQQNDRYDLSKQVKQVEWNKYTERGAVKLVTITPTTGNAIELPVDENGFVSNNAGTQFDGQRIDNVIGKEIGDKIVSENNGDLSGDGLKVGGKGMKGFYGSPTEGSLGIVGNVAKSLFKQVPKIIEIKSAYEGQYSTGEGNYVDGIGIYDGKGDMVAEFDTEEEANDYIKSKDSTTQHSIDITPELKAEAEQGQPLFQDRKGSWTKDAARMKRIINMYEKADSTTAVHEMLGHDYLDRIIEASATNKESEADLRIIAEEYIKDTKSKEKVEDIIKALKDFDVEKNKTAKGTSVHEWFATQAEQYFATEKDVKRETPQQSKMAKIFEAFRAHLAELYDIMNKTLIAPSEPMKQVFRKVFGEENFNKAEEIRAENVEAINTLNAAALEGNRKAGGLKSLADKLKEKGLGQSEFAQDIWDAASELIANGKAKRYNVTDAMKEMFPAIEGDIENMRKVLQTIGTTGELRQGAENILANPNISDEVKEKVAKMSEYTPEKLKQVGLSTNEVIDYYIGEYGEVSGLEKIKSLLDKGEFDGYTEKVAIQQSLIGMYNKLAKFGATEQIRKEALNNAVDVAEQYINQGTSLGRAINAYKLLGSLTTEGRLVWAKRQTNKYVKPAHEALKENIRDLKAELKDAYKQVDYFFEQTLGREETEGQYKEAIAQYQAEIDALKARKPREPKPSKTAYKGVKATREFRESDLANFAKDILAGGLFQDMETMTAPQKLAYGIMEKKPINISEFAKAFGRYLGKKIDPKELESLYVQTRDLLITKDLAFADGLSTNEQLRADLDGLEVANKAKIEELERKKAEAEAKIAAKAKKGEKKEHSEELADFVIKDAKKAMNGAIAKQKTYLDEILKALKEKTADVINKGKKDKIQTAKVSEVEAIKFALDAINNGGADANMWNDAVEQVKAKIKADNDLSQAEKDNLTQYLDNYTNFIYDNLLSENKIFKVIREKLIQSGYGNGTLVNWKQIIEGANGDVDVMRESIQELVKNQLKDYDNAQVENVLDAIVRKYDQEINKQRKKIADKYVEKELGDKKSTKKKTAAVQGKIGKLLVENRLGILKDGNEDILNELAAAKGLKSMSEKDWKRAAELAENVENSADGILKNRAIEEMTAFIASKQPLSFMNTASSLRFAGLLGRVTTVAVNLISGAIEGGLLAGGRAIRGNTSFIKESFKGVSKGGFKDILFGGGINQASKTSVEVNSSGMPYFRALEYYEGKGKKIIKSGKYVGRVLDATDSVFQEMFGSGYDRVYLEKQIALENPNATKAEIDQMVNDALSKTKYDEFYAQALQDVIKSGQKPTPANVKRRTYEILRESQVSQMAIDLSDLESREKTFKSEFKENRGLATLFGSMLASSSNVSRKVVEPVAEYMFKLSGYNEKQAAELAKKIGDVIPNKIMPFTRGVSNVIEKALEKDIVYGLTKSLIVNLGVNKMPTTTMEEKMAKARAEEKVKDLATTAIFTNILIYGVGSLLYAASKAWDDDEEKEGRNPEKTGVYPIQSQKTSIGSTSSAKERATPENTLVLFGQKIPLKWLGSIGAELSLTANINKALTKDSKSSGAEKVANAALDISESYMQQSFMMSQNDKQSVVALLRDENVNWDKVEDYMINDMISYGGSYVLWSGFVNQSLQGARYLSGDKSYQEAKTISEKLQKQVGLAGITYDNKKLNYMGRPLEATEVNREGIQGLLGMFSKSYKSPIESWVENVGYKESLVSRGSKQLARIESESFVSPTNEQYDDFTDNTRKLIGKGIEFAYSKRNEVVVPLNKKGELEINKKTGKAYTADEYTNKLLNDMSNAIEGYKRTELVNKLDVNKYDRDEYLSKLEDYYYKLKDAMYEFYIKGSLSTKESKEDFGRKVDSILPPPPKE